MRRTAPNVTVMRRGSKNRIGEQNDRTKFCTSTNLFKIM